SSRPGAWEASVSYFPEDHTFPCAAGFCGGAGSALTDSPAVPGSISYQPSLESVPGGAFRDQGAGRGLPGGGKGTAGQMALGAPWAGVAWQRLLYRPDSGFAAESSECVLFGGDL